MKKLLCLVGSLIIALGLFGAQNGVSTTHAFTEEDQAYIESARQALQDIVQEREVLAMVYLTNEYPIRTEPAYDSEVVMNVTSGQSVLIQDIHVEEKQNEDGMMIGFDVWEYVTFYHGEQQHSGYIPRYYLACSDERFLNWEMEFGMNPAAYGMMTTDTGETVAIDPNADIKAFPESYQAALLALRQKYPNWTFVAMNTGLDWQTVINNEIGGGKSLVYKTLPSWAKEGLYDDGQWYYASEAALKFYMDPRNHLSEASIFQFEQLTYNESYHTEAALETFLSKTFMAGNKNAPGTDMTFCKIFWSLGDRDKVSPFHLAARVYQEQGAGTSPLISGTYPGYEGYYNYFNVGATGKTDTEEIISGLEYAKNNWGKGAYYAIEGGAKFISKNYILKGQDTLYLQKYNVNPSGAYPLYTHQYMQNITAPTTEGASMKKLYEGVGALNNTFVFKIPVYNNMPATAVAQPAASTNVVLSIPSGYSDTTVYLDGVAYTAAKRDGRYIVTAPNANAKTAVVYQYNASGVPVGMYVWTLSYADAIEGGAKFISKNYILKGQDTLYLQKYNVNPSGAYPLYTHQYMQNITAPTTEGASMKKLYEGVGALNNTFVFKIPVYNNMPATAVAQPAASTNVVLSIPSGYSDTTVYLDGVAYTAAKRDGRYIVTAPNANAKTAVVYQYNASGVPVGMYVWTLSYADGAYTATAQPGLQNLLSYHGFSIRITGKAGIRYKTGISTDLRKTLTTTGVNGYVLKEYGTVVMNNENRTKYPMIKGGEKTLTGMAYGQNADGTKVDSVYETVDGRYRFTSVLVGMPATQYKIEYAFRGYAILEKGGQQITLYGPIQARSIYSLAQQVLSSGKYQAGSDTEVFLKKLISDADAVQTQ